MNERNWGGKRKGAGRKKGDIEYKSFTVVLPMEEYELLQELAVRHEMTASAFISKYLGLKDYLKIEKSHKDETK